METLAVQFIEKAPYVASLILVVWMFLRHLRFRDKEFSDLHGASIAALSENTKAVGELTAMVRGLNGSR